MNKLQATAVVTLFVFFMAGCAFVEIGGDAPSPSSSGAQAIANRDITGNIQIALAWGQRLTPPRDLSRAIVNLQNAIHKYTQLSVTLNDHLRLSSPSIMNMPFVYVTADTQFDLTPTEIENLRNYLSAGGFILLDNSMPQHEESPVEASMRKMARDILGSGARFRPLPNDHDIYRSYFNFDGPPMGVENQTVTRSSIPVVDDNGNPTGQMRENRAMPRRVPYLEGIQVGDHIGVVLANKGYGHKWTEFANNEPQLKMGVNFVVYALTMPGGVADAR